MTGMLVSMALVAALAAAWVAVQRAWGRTFVRECRNSDVLLGRGSCRGDCDTGSCERGGER